MPDNSENELDSPTTVIGEDEGNYFSDKSNELSEQSKLLTAQLEHAESWIKTLKAELEEKIWDYQDYQKYVEGQFEIKDRAVRLADQKITKLERDKKGWENQADYLTQLLQKITKQRDNYHQELEEIIYLLEQEQLNNQIAYDFLNTLAYERDNLAKNCSIYKGKIKRRDKKIEIYEKELDESDNLLADKNSQLDKAIKQRDGLKTKVSRLRELRKRDNEEWKEINNELEIENQELKNKLGALALELGKEKVKNQKLTKDKEIFKDLAKHYEWKYKFNQDKKIKLIKKLQAIREQQELDAKTAKKENVCQTLIKWEGVPKNENIIFNQSLENNITSTNVGFINTIATTQQHLGDDVDLTKITTTHKMPKDENGKKLGLGDLITFYENNKNNTPPPPQTRIITSLEPQEPNETIIVERIIQECDLGLSENSTLTQVINKIKKLIKVKPPVVQSVIKNDTPFGESLETIIQVDLYSLEKELGINLSKATKKQFQKATNYQELSSLRNQEIKSYLEKGSGDLVITKSTQPAPLLKEERLFWLILLALSILTIGGLLLKVKRGKKEKS